MLPWVWVRPTCHRIGAEGEYNDGDGSLTICRRDGDHCPGSELVPQGRFL